MAEILSNDCNTTLNGSITNVATTLVVNSTTGFPGTGNFRIRIDNEILLVTGVSGTTWTVSRAVEPVAGTAAAASHANGAPVFGVLTVAALQQSFNVSIGTAIGSSTAGSVLYIDGSGNLAQEAGYFVYDPDGTLYPVAGLGGLGTGTTLYIGSGSTYTGTIALWDKNNSAWRTITATNSGITIANLLTLTSGFTANGPAAINSALTVKNSGGTGILIKTGANKGLLLQNGTGSATYGGTTSDGYFYTLKNSAPTPSDASSCTWSLVDTANNSKVVFTLLDSGSTSTTASLSSNTNSGYVYGFPLSWASTSTVNVGFPNKNAKLSVCRDSTNQQDIYLAGGTQYTISSATNGAALGDDSFTGPGTVATATSTAVTGTSTTFTTSFGVRTCSGTITSAAAVVTGTGTFFTTEFAVNDLIGTASLGYYQITAITSDTSLTIVSTPGTAFTGQTPNCIEQPFIFIATGNGIASTPVTTITSDTALVMNAAAGGTASGLSYTIGKYPSNIATIPPYMFVFVGNGSSGTTAYWSTQRTTPFGITNYNSYWRRIGSIRVLSGGNVEWFDQIGLGIDRIYVFENSNSNLKVVSGTTSITSWTTVTANKFSPPTATALLLSLSTSTTTTFAIFVRRTSTGSSSTNRGMGIMGLGGSSPGGGYTVPCTGAQQFDYVTNSASANNTIYNYGYVESL